MVQQGDGHLLQLGASEMLARAEPRVARPARPVAQGRPAAALYGRVALDEWRVALWSLGVGQIGYEDVN